MQNEKLSQLTSFIGTVYTVGQQHVKGLVYLHEQPMKHLLISLDMQAKMSARICS